MKKRIAYYLCFIFMCFIAGFMYAGKAEAKTTTKIYKESPTGSSFKLRLGETKKIKMIIYANGYNNPVKKVSVSSSDSSIISVGKTKYKKLTYTDWYGRKTVEYRATITVKPIKIGTATLTVKTKSGKKVKWKVNVRNAFTKQMAEGELGFIKWMLEKDDLSEERRNDLNEAKRILELASKEKISDWLPNLKDVYGNKVKNGITLDCSKKTDAAYISRLHANYKAYKELVKMQNKDPYRKIYMNYNYSDTTALPNSGCPYTNFKTVVGSMVDEDRFDIYHHHNPSWGRISSDNIEYSEDYYFACAEVWASSNAASSVDAWFGERSYVDDAVKKLGYNKNNMTYKQLDKALDKASGLGVIGHYTFCVFATHDDILGFASSSDGSLGHQAWSYDDDDSDDFAKYTFKEMDDYVTEYLDEIGY